VRHTRHRNWVIGFDGKAARRVPLPNAEMTERSHEAGEAVTSGHRHADRRDRGRSARTYTVVTSVVTQRRPRKDLACASSGRVVSALLTSATSFSKYPAALSRSPAASPASAAPERLR